MVHIGAADDELHRCLLSQETESAADCVLTTSTEDQPGRCELLGAAGTLTARVRSAFCGTTELAFWRQVLKLAFASKRDLKERAMQGELARRKPGLLASGLGTSEPDREAEDTSAASLDWWKPKRRPHCAPEAAPVTGEGLDVVEAGSTRQRCVGPPASSATAAPAPAPAPVTKAPWHSACLIYVNTKASREDQSQSESQSQSPPLSPPPPPPPVVSSSGYDDTVSGAHENESMLAPSTTAVCHIAGGLAVTTFGFAAVGLLLVVRRGARRGRRSERERRRASDSGGLLSPGRASSESSSSSCPGDIITQ